MTYDRHTMQRSNGGVGTTKRPERFYASVLGAVLGSSAVLVGVFVQKDWSVWGYLAAGVVAMGCVWAARSTWTEAHGRWRTASLVIGGLVVVFVGIGVSSQLLIEGEPVLSISDAAQANRVVSDLLADLEAMGKYDELLAASDADARARYNDYEPAAKALLRIANTWSRVDLGELPDPDLIDVVQHVKTGATFGAKAIELKQQTITEPDARAEAAMRENRDVFIGEALNAGAKLRPLAEKYQVQVYDVGGLE